MTLVAAACSSGEEPPRDTDTGVDFSSLSLPSGDPYDEYEIVHDDSRALAVEVPEAWSDVDGRPAELEGVTIAGVWAAPEIEGFKEAWNEPGVALETRPGELASPGAKSVLAEKADGIDETGSCAESEGAQPYETYDHTGFYELWSDCGDPEAALLYFVVDDSDDSEDTLLVLEVQMLTQADIEAAERALDTFQYTPGEASTPEVTPKATVATEVAQSCVEAMDANAKLLDLQDQAIEAATAGIAAGRTGDSGGVDAAMSKLAETGAIDEADELSGILTDVVETATQAVSAYNAGDTAGVEAALSRVAELRGKASIVDPAWQEAASTCRAG